MVVITAISIDVCACVITTATSIKAPCISQSRSSPPASSSCLGESFPEESLRGCRLPRKQEVPLGNPSGCWARTPPLGRPLRVTTVPSGFGFPGTGRLRPPPAWTAQLPDSGAQPQGSPLSIEDHGETELGIWRAQRWAVSGERDLSRGRCRLVGGWGSGAWFLVCSFSGFLEKPTTVRRKPERSELRWHTCEERRTTSGRHGHWSLSHGTPSRDCWWNLSNL